MPFQTLYKNNYARYELKIIAEASLLLKEGDGGLKNFQLRLGALLPRSVGWSVGLSVVQKLQKNYKTLQNITKRHKTLQIIEISYGSMPELP